MVLGRGYISPRERREPSLVESWVGFHFVFVVLPRFVHLFAMAAVSWPTSPNGFFCYDCNVKFARVLPVRFIVLIVWVVAMS